MMMNVPDDMFKQELLQYLTVDDIVQLDNACMNHKHRPQLMEKIGGVILVGDKVKPTKALLFIKWLGMRRIYLINMNLHFEYDTSFSSTMENDYVDQFRFTQHVVMKGPIIDDGMAIFIISHCPCLLLIDISSTYYYCSSSPQLTDHTLMLIAEHCTGLQSLSLNRCYEITNTGLITVSEQCTNLQSLKINYSDQISDASILSISIHCTGLLSLDLVYCNQVTDVSIISISTHCTGLQSLNLKYYDEITDASIIPISENCTGLKRLDISCTDITDASLIAIAKNCTGLQLLSTYECDGLSREKLCRHFKSVSELRAVLLSIYPFLPI